VKQDSKIVFDGQAKSFHYSIQCSQANAPCMFLPFAHFPEHTAKKKNLAEFLIELVAV
jgi:hypothetical protein